MNLPKQLTLTHILEHDAEIHTDTDVLPLYTPHGLSVIYGQAVASPYMRVTLPCI